MLLQAIKNTKQKWKESGDWYLHKLFTAALENIPSMKEEKGHLCQKAQQWRVFDEDVAEYGTDEDLQSSGNKRPIFQSGVVFLIQFELEQEVL